MNNIAATDIPFIMVDRIIDNPVVQEKVTANVKGDTNASAIRAEQGQEV